jgi:CRISPR/Cas system-associated endonuclease/helicase Cas3
MTMNHFNQPVKESGKGYITNKHQVRPSNRDDMHNEYVGNKNSYHKEAMSYSDMYNAIISGAKEELLEGREPTTSNVSLPSGSNNVHLNIKKLNEDSINNRSSIITQQNYVGNNIDHYKKSHTSMRYKDSENTRFNPNLIDYMKDNPYVNKTLL